MSNSSKDLFYYPWYVDRWRQSRSRVMLTLQERGLYRELLDEFYLHGPIPNREDVLCRIAGCDKKELRKCLKNVIVLFKDADGFLIHEASEEIRAKIEASAEKNRVRAKTAAQSRWSSNATSNATSIPSSNAYAMPSESLKLKSVKETPLPPADESSGEESALSHLSMFSESMGQFDDPPGQAPPDPAEPISYPAIEFASRIHKNHPSVRRGMSASSVVTALQKIAKKLKLKTAEQKQTAFSEITDRHERWCRTRQWTKDGGEYAKGLANWLSTANDLYLTDPPPEELQRKQPESTGRRILTDEGVPRF
jgi:uncharacterized protein YdaU (DUF1376 family)